MTYFDWAVAAVAFAVLAAPAVWEYAEPLLSRLRVTKQADDLDETGWRQHWVNQLIHLQDCCETEGNDAASSLVKRLIWELLGGGPLK